MHTNLFKYTFNDIVGAPIDCFVIMIYKRPLPFRDFSKLL